MARRAEQELDSRIKTFLGEFRMIIPAMAALLGFQLTTAFQASFDTLAALDRTINFGGLACTAAALLALLVPASYHRFVANAHETEQFLTVARRSIGAAFVFMPLSIAATLYVQAVRTFGSHAGAVATGALALMAFVALWWLLPMQVVRRDPESRFRRT